MLPKAGPGEAPQSQQHPSSTSPPAAGHAAPPTSTSTAPTLEEDSCASSADFPPTTTVSFVALQQLAMAKATAAADTVEQYQALATERAKTHSATELLTHKQLAAVEDEDYEAADSLEDSINESKKTQERRTASMTVLLGTKFPAKCEEYFAALAQLHQSAISGLEARCAELDLDRYQRLAGEKRAALSHKQKECEELRHFARQQLLDLDSQHATLAKQHAEMDTTYQTATRTLQLELEGGGRKARSCWPRGGAQGETTGSGDAIHRRPSPSW